MDFVDFFVNGFAVVCDVDANDFRGCERGLVAFLLPERGLGNWQIYFDGIIFSR